MNREELSQALTDIGTVTDEAQRRNLITQVTGAVNDLFQTNETLTQANTAFEQQVQQLQGYNMELYLQVQGQKKKDDPIVQRVEKTPLKFENLFDDKGDLK